MINHNQPSEIITVLDEIRKKGKPYDEAIQKFNLAYSNFVQAADEAYQLTRSIAELNSQYKQLCQENELKPIAESNFGFTFDYGPGITNLLARIANTTEFSWNFRKLLPVKKTVRPIKNKEE